MGAENKFCGVSLLSKDIVMRILALICISAILSGCADRLSGVGIPEPKTIAEYAGDTVKQNHYLNEAGEKVPLTAGQYIISSISYTNVRCHEFFELLTRAQQDSTFIDKVLTAAAVAGAPLLAQSASAEGVALFTSSINSGNSLQKDAAEIYIFAKLGEPLKRLVFDKMKTYLETRESDLKRKLSEYGRTPESFRSSMELSDLVIARSFAAGYASLCSLASMREIVSEQVNSAAVVAGMPAGSAVRGPTVAETKEAIVSPGLPPIQPNAQ